MLNQKELENLDFEWTKILKKIQILKILSFIEAIIVLYLAFVLSKDVVIAFCLSVFVGIVFYKLCSRKLLQRQKIIKNELLSHFLRKNHAKFTGKSFDTTNLNNFPFAEFKAINGIEFKDFTLYDASFKNANDGTFMGIFIELKEVKFKKNLPLSDENALFKKLKNVKFSTNTLYIKDKFALIASLTNPFFISSKLSLSQNLDIMKANLAQIQSLLA